jgi:hypothetical protein
LSRATTSAALSVISTLLTIIKPLNVIARSESDEAIHSFVKQDGLLRFARNDGLYFIPLRRLTYQKKPSALVL